LTIRRGGGGVMDGEDKKYEQNFEFNGFFSKKSHTVKPVVHMRIILKWMGGHYIVLKLRILLREIINSEITLRRSLGYIFVLTFMEVVSSDIRCL
jgi:hypothetical protein